MKQTLGIIILFLLTAIMLGIFLMSVYSNISLMMQSAQIQIEELR